MSLINALLLLAFAGASYAAWAGTPGLAARYGALEWFLLPAFAGAMVAFCSAFAAALPSRPRWLNLPDRDRFLALTPERQAPVLREGQRLLHWVATEAVVLMGLIQLGLYVRPAAGGLNAFMVMALGFGALVSPLVAFVFLGRMQAEVSRQAREQRAAEGAPGGAPAKHR